MARQIRVETPGGPEVLKLVDLPVAAPGPSEVQIEQKAIGLNFIDIYFRSGLYPPPGMPFVPGNEAAGIIRAVGAGVTAFQPGDRVGYVGSLGAYTETCNIVASSVVKLPRGVSFEVAAAIMLKGLTAEYLLFRTFKVKPGHVVLIHAAAGGTGLILCQWAKALGATVIGTVGSPAKAQLASGHGCDHVIDYNKEDFAKRVSEITRGTKCDVVYDGVGKSTFAGSLDCLKTFGTLVNFGNASGAVDSFNLGVLASKGSLYVTRPTLFTHIAKSETYDSMVERLFRAIGKGTINVPAPTRFKLADAAYAHRALEGRATTGSIVLIP